MPTQLKVFRQKSMERLSQPDRLDELMEVTRPQGWLLLSTVAFLMAAALIWSAAGSVAVQEPVEGLLMSRGERRDLVAPAAGVVQQVAAKTGAVLPEGGSLASLSVAGEPAVSVSVPMESRVLEILVRPGQRVSSGQLLGSVEAADAKLHAVLWSSIATSRTLQPGMEARLSPAGTPPQQFGFLLGRVAQIEAVPSTRRAMVSALGDEALAARLFEGGRRVRIDVDLLPSAQVEGAWAWTSTRTPAPVLTTNTPLTGTVVIERSPPIRQILPWLSSERDSR